MFVVFGDLWRMVGLIYHGSHVAVKLGSVCTETLDAGDSQVCSRRPSGASDQGVAQVAAWPLPL